MEPTKIMEAVGRARAYLAGGDSPPYKADTTKLLAEALVAMQDKMFEKAVAGDIVERETAYSPPVILAQAARSNLVIRSGHRELVAVELPRNCRIVDGSWPSMEVAREQDELHALRVMARDLVSKIRKRPQSGDEVVIDAMRDFCAQALAQGILTEDEVMPWAR